METEKSCSGLYQIKPVQQIIASSSGALLTSLFVTPFDVVKIRLQAQRNPFSKGKCFVYCNGLMDHLCVCENGNSKAWYKAPGRFRGTMDAFVQIIRNEGIKSLWSGLPPTLVMAVPATAIYFTCFDQLRGVLIQEFGRDTGSASLLAGALARLGAVTVISPLELIRTKMQFHPLTYKELQLCISSSVAKDGWLSLWRGWGATVLRDVPFSALYWYNYEHEKQWLCQKYGIQEPTFMISFTSGAVSGSRFHADYTWICFPTWLIDCSRAPLRKEFRNLLELIINHPKSNLSLSCQLEFIEDLLDMTQIAALVTLPFDVVKTRKQIEIGESEAFNTLQKRSPSTWKVINQILLEDGFRGLFVGLIPRLIKIAPACAIMISTYEFGKAFFHKLNKDQQLKNI